MHFFSFTLFPKTYAIEELPLETWEEKRGHAKRERGLSQAQKRFLEPGTGSEVSGF